MVITRSDPTGSSIVAMGGKGPTDVIAVTFDWALWAGSTYNLSRVTDFETTPRADLYQPVQSIRAIWGSPSAEYIAVGTRSNGSGPLWRWTGPHADCGTCGGTSTGNGWQSIGKFGVPWDSFDDWRPRDAVFSDADTAWVVEDGPNPYRVSRFETATLEFFDVPNVQGVGFGSDRSQ